MKRRSSPGTGSGGRALVFPDHPRRAPDRTRPGVSVIIPTYDRAEVVGEAIDSVLAQSYEELEIIVVDDGSTDATDRLLAERYGGVSRIRRLRKQNGGPAAARNFGLRFAGGELVAFLDSDDLWTPDKLALQVRHMDEHPEAAMSFTDAVGEGEGDDGRTFFQKRAFRGDTSLHGLAESHFPIRTPCVAVRRSILQALGGFDESFLCTEDKELWVRIAVAHPVICLKRPLTVVRRRRDSIRTTHALENRRCEVRFWEKHQNLLLKAGCPRALIRRRHAHAHRSLARACREAGRYDEARRHYLRAWGRRPARMGDLALWIGLALLPRSEERTLARHPR